ncbi:MAG: tRNA (guanosine(46)-N7)-methyltransferase TrmB [Aerococcus sp.]|nr:tRNA (guanosine(46)-N7)-methyltransferase TrmB [Aerococcus sp.]
MRVRHKPWAQDLINAHPEWVIQTPEEHAGHWQALFAEDKPLHVEVGTGKGQFIIEMAKAHPEWNFVGIEMQSDVLVMALQQVLDNEPLTNLRFVRSDGQHIDQFFMIGEVSQLYLNFSDPWPKRRHAKRRLTHPDFLKHYQQVLATDGSLIFKTDNRGLFEYSLCSFSQFGMQLVDVSLDLHHSHFVGNITTEYEDKFSAKGQPIYRVEAIFNTAGALAQDEALGISATFHQHQTD